MTRTPQSRPTRRTSAAILAAAAALVAVTGAAPARGGTFTWTGGDPTYGYLTLGDNWVGGVAPPSNGTADLVFGSANPHGFVPTDPNGFSIDSVTFNAASPSYTVAGLSGKTLTVGGGGITDAATAAQAVTEPVALSADQSWNVSAGGGSLSVTGGVNTGGHQLAVVGPGSATVSGLAGTGGLTVDGTGTLTLTGTDTYTGGTTLAGGTLALGAAAALGTTGTITFAGGTLQFSAADTTDYSARFAARNGTYDIDTNGQNVTFAALGAGSTAAALTKVGAGTLTLSAASTVSGYLIVNAGTLAITGSANVSSGSYATVTGTAANPAVLSVGGTARLTGSRSMYVGYGGVGSVNQSAGTVDLSATGAELFVGLTAGLAAGSQGHYLLTGGTADVYSLSVGTAGGAGTFTQQGGTVAVAGLGIGDGSTGGGSGGYALSAGTLTATTGISIDNAGTPAVFQQSGGAVSATAVTVAYNGNSSTPGSGTYTLTGGTLTTPTLQLALNGNSSGVFTLGGSGTLIAGTVTGGGTGAAFHFDGGTFQPSASQTLSGLGTLDVQAGGGRVRRPDRARTVGRAAVDPRRDGRGPRRRRRADQGRRWHPERARGQHLHRPDGRQRRLPGRGQPDRVGHRDRAGPGQRRRHPGRRRVGSTFEAVDPIATNSGSFALTARPARFTTCGAAAVAGTAGRSTIGRRTAG